MIVRIPWFDSNETAYLEHDGQTIGIAGMMNNAFLKKFAEGSAFVFELNATILATYKKPFTRFEPLSKYPSIVRDISMMVPLQYLSKSLNILSRALTSIYSQ